MKEAHLISPPPKICADWFKNAQVTACGKMVHFRLTRESTSHEINVQQVFWALRKADNLIRLLKAV